MDDSFVPSEEWRYFYNPSGEREMKRMISSPDGKTNYYTYPWVKYVLGADNKQLAVYTGAEVADQLQAKQADCNASPVLLPPFYVDIKPNFPNNAYVIMAPSEYIVYGAGMNPIMSWKLGDNGQWFRHFKVMDYLGSTRTEVLAKDRSGTETYLQAQYDYEPYGGVNWSWQWAGDLYDSSRTKYIGKEMDKESNLADHGVRKYENEVGVFTSIDPLWEEYNSWTPYQYAGNNPIMALDWNYF